MYLIASVLVFPGYMAVWSAKMHGMLGSGSDGQKISVQMLSIVKGQRRFLLQFWHDTLQPVDFPVLIKEDKLLKCIL